MGLFEVMEITEGIRDLIIVGATTVEIKKRALEEGMISLRMSGLEKIKQGITTIEEVLRETVDDRFDTPPGVLRPPQLTLDVIELRETQLHVKGRTQPGVTVTVNGERIPVQQDGSFNEHVVLRRGATAVAVRATGVNGAMTEQQLPIVVPK